MCKSFWLKFQLLYASLCRLFVSHSIEFTFICDSFFDFAFDLLRISVYQSSLSRIPTILHFLWSIIPHLSFLSLAFDLFYHPLLTLQRPYIFVDQTPIFSSHRKKKSRNLSRLRYSEATMNNTHVRPWRQT